MRALELSIAATGLAALLAGPALAHPHVWVVTRAEMLFASDGKVAGLRHAWTFDEGYSAYAVQGLLKDGKLDPVQARDLARTNLESLADSGYFTVLRLGGAKQEFAPATDGEIGIEGERLTLRFTLPLKTPQSATRALLDVYDPTFFVDLALAPGEDAVRLTNAPAGCTASIQRPKSQAGPDRGKPPAESSLSESFFQAMTSASLGNMPSATRTAVTCR